MLDLLEAGKTREAEEALREARKTVLPKVEDIRVKLDGLIALETYVEKWRGRLSGPDYWHKFLRQRTTDMRALFSQQMRRPAENLITDRPHPVTERDLQGLFDEYGAKPPGRVLAAFPADAWLGKREVWRGVWGIGPYTNGAARTVAIVFPDRTVSAAGDYAEVAASISAPPFRSRLLLDVFVQDTRQSGRGKGYRVLQLWANRALVWSEDIVMDRTGRAWVTADITKTVSPGEKLQLRFRVEDRQPVGNLTVAFAGPFQLRGE